MTTQSRVGDGRGFQPQGGNVTGGIGVEVKDAEVPSAEELVKRLARNATDVRLIEDADVREAIRTAGVIYGVDRSTGRVVPVWGKSVCEAIARSGIARRVPVVAFRLDFDSDELEYLVVACEVIKGVSYKDELLSFRFDVA